MKYIKKFENQEEFKIGDYVRLKDNVRSDLDYKELVYDSWICKVFKIDDCEKYKSKIISQNQETWFWVKNTFIRHLTEEELDRLQLHININKYNL